MSLHIVTVSRAELKAWKSSSLVPIALDTHAAEELRDYTTVIMLLHAVYVDMIGEKGELTNFIAML